MQLYGARNCFRIKHKLKEQYFLLQSHFPNNWGTDFSAIVELLTIDIKSLLLKLEQYLN